MNQGLAFERRLCARNAGIFIAVRLILGSLVFLALGTIFYVPGETMLVAVQGVKANVFLFIGVICALFFMSLFSLIVAFPLNNALSSVDKSLSLQVAILRVIEVFVFVAGMVLLFAEIPLFHQVLLFSVMLYGFVQFGIGNLVYKSGFLSRVLGIFLIIGGVVGYLLESMVPSYALVSTIGVLVAIIAEFALAITLVMKAMQMTPDSADTNERVIRILKVHGESTTKEIIVEASKESSECKDRVPTALVNLEQDGLIAKRFSKEKKGYVWALTS